MVEQPDPDGAGAVGEPKRYASILLAGRRISGWMIVRDSKRDAVLSQHGMKHLAHRKWRAGCGATREGHAPHEPMPGGEHHDQHLLTPREAKLVLRYARNIMRSRNALSRAEHASRAKLEGREKARRLRRAHPCDRHKLVRISGSERCRITVRGEQSCGKFESARALAPAAQHECNQLRIGERCGAETLEPLARAIMTGMVGEAPHVESVDRTARR